MNCNTNDDNPFPSLHSEFDCEPNLEFDDDLTTPTDEHKTIVDDIDDADDTLLMDNSLDYEQELAHEDMAEEEEYESFEEQVDEFEDIRRMNIVEVCGDDRFARTVITIYAERLPNNKDFDWNRFLRYMLQTLDTFVETDYTLVYFHYGLNQKNKPPKKFLWTAFRSFDRKYKKHLKQLLLVHPTPFVRFVLSLFRPLISAKFGRKIENILRLEELSRFLHLNQLSIPQSVIEHDRALKSSAKSVNQLNDKNSDKSDKVFGVSLKSLYIRSGDPIPLVINQCVTFLENEASLQTEGLFRRSASVQSVKECQRKYDCGQTVDFRSIDEAEGATHLAAALLKAFLRQLSEPLLTFELFDDVIDFYRLKSHVERVTVAQALIKQRLPHENRQVLEYLVRFLRKVINRSDLNKMNAKNLSIVLGPNLLWARDSPSTLETVKRVNHFSEFVFTNDVLIFNDQ